jgi:hypothetical protein
VDSPPPVGLQTAVDELGQVIGNRPCGVLQRRTCGESAINHAQPIDLALSLLASPDVLFDKSKLLAVQSPIGV